MSENLSRGIKLLENDIKKKIILLVIRLYQSGYNDIEFLLPMVIINRLFLVIDGFCQMINQNNSFCAISLLRLQLDNLIRFNAIWLVDDRTKLIHAIVKGTNWNRIKAKKGKNTLTDSYMHQQASKKFPWVSSAYEASCKYIHLSTPHFDDCVRLVDEEKRIFEVRLSLNDRKWPEEGKIQCLMTFTEATKCIINLIEEYCDEKNLKMEKNGISSLVVS